MNVRQFTITLYLLIATSTFLIPCSFGQHSYIHKDVHRWYRSAVELYNTQKFTAATEHFQRFLQYNTQDEERIASKYYLSICALELEHPDFEFQILDFIQEYPTHPLTNQGYHKLGSFYFNENNYSKSLEYLDKLDLMSFSSEKEIEAIYQKGYSLMKVARTDEALKHFNWIKKGYHIYIYYASYYAAFLEYKKGDYNLASKDLDRAVKDKNLRSEIELLRPAILYKQEKHKEALILLHEIQVRDGRLPAPLAAIAGDIYFITGNYEKAIEYLLAYKDLNKVKSNRAISYRLGYCFLLNKDLNLAVRYLSEAADGTDSLAQLGGYHLGVAYLQLEDKLKALISFSSASHQTYNPEVREMCFFLRAKTNYEMRDFGRTIDVCMDYIATYPNGKHLTEIDELLSNSYQYTERLDEAIAYFKQKVNGQDTRAMYQKIAFNKAATDFNDRMYPEAIEMFYETLRYPEDKNINSNVHFWLGEIFTITEKYDSALSYYQRVPYHSEYYTEAQYGMGFVFFNQKKYQQAITPLKTYVETHDQNKIHMNNAALRLADCFYTQKQYRMAFTVYDSAFARDNIEKDYILFQKGMIFQLNGMANASKRTFTEIIKRYPTSNYIPQTYFELSNITAKAGRKEEAIEWLEKLFTKYPEHVLIPEGLNKAGMHASLIQDYPKAIDYYTRFLNSYHNDPSAHSAIEALQDLKVNGVDVPNLQRYIETYAGANPESTLAIKADYDHSLIPFKSGIYQEAIETLELFVTKHPTTEFSGEAYYKLGYAYEKTDQPRKALESYLHIEGGDYHLKATRNIGEIYLTLNEFTNAKEVFYRLRNSSSNKKFIRSAEVGLMIAAYGLKKPEQIRKHAEYLSTNFTREKDQATLYVGKAFLLEKEYNRALDQFRLVTENSKNIYAAEAQYLTGYIFSLTAKSQEDYEKSNDELIKLSKQYERYADWIYKGYLLIAKNLIKTNNILQAKNTLKSIIEYCKIPEIKQEAEQISQELEDK